MRNLRNGLNDEQDTEHYNRLFIHIPLKIQKPEQSYPIN
jgi:hypothetical protein